MIPKKLRLKEKELKKVLQKGKPFFSYGIVVNYFPNILGFSRFGIVLSGKSVPTNVVRNFFRRYFYQILQKTFFDSSFVGYDIVFVIKKQKFLDKNDEKSIRDFAGDIGFLLKKLYPLFHKVTK